MDTPSSIILIGGISGLLSLLLGDFLIYQRYMRTKADLFLRIANAENELRKDIQDIDQKELRLTQAGNELLKLIANEEKDSSKLKTNSSRVWSIKNFNFTPGYGYALAAVTIILGLALGYYTSTIKESVFGPQIAEAQAEQISLQTINQQQIYEIQLQMQETENPTQIVLLQDQQIVLENQQIAIQIQIENQQEIQKKALTIQNVLTGITALSCLLLIFNVSFDVFKKFGILKAK